MLLSIENAPFAIQRFLINVSLYKFSINVLTSEQAISDLTAPSCLPVWFHWQARGNDQDRMTDDQRPDNNVDSVPMDWQGWLRREMEADKKTMWKMGVGLLPSPFPVKTCWFSYLHDDNTLVFYTQRVNMFFRYNFCAKGSINGKNKTGRIREVQMKWDTEI